MEIHLIRHTTPDIGKGICYGHSEVGLKASFDEECQAVLNHLPARATAVYSSPLFRCLRLAKEISSHCSIPLLIDDRLKELNFGDFENKRWEAVDQKALQDWMDDYVNVKCPNGESYRELSARVNQFLQEIFQTSYQSIIIVTHGGVMKSIDAAINKTSLEKAMEKVFDYGGIYTYTLDSKTL